MKKITLLACLFVMIAATETTSTISNINEPFYGIWEATINGNQTFKVELFSDDDGDVAGHYYLYETNSTGNEILLYTSKVHLGLNKYLGPLIYGMSNGTRLGAFVEDINHQEHKYRRLDGRLRMYFISGSGVIGTTASWIIKNTKGLRFTDDDREFIIPTDLTLTKISN